MHSAHQTILDQYTSLDIHSNLEDAQTIAIGGHLSPDGDCFGSMVGLGMILEKLGKTVHYYTPSPTPRQFSFLQLPEISDQPIDPKSYDLIIMTDTANIERSNLSHCTPSQYEDKLIMIDHHYGNTRVGGKHLIDQTIKSCCEIIAVILMDSYPELIDQRVATLLLMGILTDSGGFTWSGDRSSDLWTASVLVGDYGARKHQLQQHLFRSNSLKAIQYVGQLIGSIKKDDNVISYIVSQTELDKRGLEGDDIDLALFTMTSIDHDGVFIQFKTDMTAERPLLKCGFRTKSDTINVSDVAGLFNGGGHQQAAGARIWIQGDPQEMIHRVVDKVNKYLKGTDNK